MIIRKDTVVQKKVRLTPDDTARVKHLMQVVNYTIFTGFHDEFFKNRKQELHERQ